MYTKLWVFVSKSDSLPWKRKSPFLFFIGKVPALVMVNVKNYLYLQNLYSAVNLENLGRLFAKLFEIIGTIYLRSTPFLALTNDLLLSLGLTEQQFNVEIITSPQRLALWRSVVVRLWFPWKGQFCIPWKEQKKEQERGEGDKSTF